MIRFKFIMILLVSGLFFSIFNCNAQTRETSERLNDDLTITEIKKDIFVVTHSFPWAANSLLVKISSNDFVLVDTPYENKATELLIKWIENKFEEINLIVINTHFHVDNLGGNEYLISKNIPVYGSDLTVKLLNEKGEERKQQLLSWLNAPKDKKYFDEYKKLKFTPPNNIFKINNGHYFKVANKNIEVFYPGPGHSLDNVVVYFPQKKILFGGCMIKSLESRGLGNLGDAVLDEWPKSTKKILDKYKNCDIVIPGHGNWGDLSLVHHTLKLLNVKNKEQ